MHRLLTLIPIAVLLAVALVACGAGDDDGGFFETAASSGQSAPAMAMDEGDFAESEEMAVEEMADEAMPAAAAVARGSGDGGNGAAALQTAERRVISTGFVSLEVEDVPAAAEQVRIAAESLGGFVENSTVSGDAVEAFAEVTIRVPQDVFLDALDRVRRIGEVHSEDLRAQDVTEQFIDLNARLRSALRTEGSLLGLLDRATDVEDVIAIERELSRVRADIERLQGQLNFLERRVALATLSVSLFAPSAARTEPPSAYFGIESDDVAGDIAAVESVAASVGGLIDSSVITVDDGEASGFVEIRVPRDDFARALRAVDAIGEVRSKTVRTGEGADDPAAAYGDEPDARIDVQLQAASDGEEVVAFVVLVAVIVLAVALVAYAARRIRRRSRASRANDGA